MGTEDDALWDVVYNQTEAISTNHGPYRLSEVKLSVKRCVGWREVVGGRWLEMAQETEADNEAHI